MIVNNLPPGRRLLPSETEPPAPVSFTASREKEVSSRQGVTIAELADSNAVERQVLLGLAVSPERPRECVTHTVTPLNRPVGTHERGRVGIRSHMPRKVRVVPRVR